MLILVILFISFIQIGLYWLNLKKGKDGLDLAIILASLYVYGNYINEWFYPQLDEDDWICGNVFIGIDFAVLFYGTISTILTYIIWKKVVLKRLK